MRIRININQWYIESPNRISVFYIVIFLILTFSSCTKSKNSVCLISDEFKSYVIFDSGSYWVYRNTDGIYDSISVDSTKSDIYTGVESTLSTEVIYVYLNSSISGKMIFSSICGSSAVEQRENCEENSSSFTRHFTNGLLLDYYFCCCPSDTNNSYLTKYLGIDSATVNSIFYPKLRKFELDSVNVSSLKYLLYAKDIGLVKYQDYNGIIWELIDYKTIRFKEN